MFYSGYKWAFASGANYAERAKKMTAVIRKELPETKVGVLVPTQLYQDIRFLTDKRPDSMDHQYGWITALMLLRFIKHPAVNVAHWHSFQHFFDFTSGKQGIGDQEHLP